MYRDLNSTPPIHSDGKRAGFRGLEFKHFASDRTVRLGRPPGGIAQLSERGFAAGRKWLAD